jgi:predicted GNAT family acetyltransferase
MKIKELPSKEVLQDLFYYKNGNLFYKKNQSKGKANHVVGWIEKNGYSVTNINGVRYRIHRLIYKFHHGFCPDYIDHIDGDKQNNKIENLRSATLSENNQNSKAKKTNKLGVKGVCIERGRYKASIKIDGKSKHLGYFYSLEEAKIVYEEFSKKIHGNYSFFKRPRVHEGLRKQGMAQTLPSQDIDDWLKESIALVAGCVRGLGTNQRRVRYFGFETAHEQSEKG